MYVCKLLYSTLILMSIIIGMHYELKLNFQHMTYYSGSAIWMPLSIYFFSIEPHNILIGEISCQFQVKIDLIHPNLIVRIALLNFFVRLCVEVDDISYLPLIAFSELKTFALCQRKLWYVNGIATILQHENQTLRRNGKRTESMRDKTLP